jgi:hypothetical protein
MPATLNEKIPRAKYKKTVTKKINKNNAATIVRHKNKLISMSMKKK